MNESRQQLYSATFRPAKQGPVIFSRANLDPHYWPFKGIVWSFVVHASIFTGLVMAPVVAGHQQLTPLRDEAIIIEPDELKDVLYLPVLAESAANTISEDKPAPKDSPTPAKEGLSYPGPQPVVSNFPKVTNHIQTVLQPTLVSPQILEPPLTLPNLVRLAPPPVEAKFKVPDAATSQVRPPTAPLPLDTNLSAALRPLPAPLAEARFKNPDAANPAARPALPVPVTPLEVSLAGTMNPLAAPSAQSRFKLPDPVAPIARPSMPVPLAPNDVSLSGTIHPLAAPAAQPRFKLPDPVAPIARPTLTVPAGPSVVQMSGPPGPLAAPVAESRFKMPDATVAPARQGNAAAPVAQMDLPSGPAKPLAAPLAESRFKAPESVATVARPSATSATTPTEVSLSGPARPLAAPLAESRFKTPDAAAPARPGPVAVSSLEGPPLSPITPLGPPVPPKPIEAASKPNDPTQNLLTLSPTPARRDQQAVIPPGEARGQFAISPTPNLNFPGTEPGARGGAGTSTSPTVAGVLLPPNANATNNRGTAAPAPNSSSFSGITILSPESLGTSRVAINVPPIGPGVEPLQTSYGIMLLASGRSGGGLPDVGVFLNDVVHTVYLDMRKTIVESPISWTVEFGLPQKAATPTDERVTTVSSQQEVLLPFPITKERPVMPADLARKYPGKLVLAYAVINAEGKLEQLAIKQSPDPLLNEIVLTSLRKWTFRPARRGGEVVPAKILLGIPVPTD